jgi:hypothetical protein
MLKRSTLLFAGALLVGLGLYWHTPVSRPADTGESSGDQARAGAPLSRTPNQVAPPPHRHDQGSTPAVARHDDRTTLDASDSPVQERRVEFIKQSIEETFGKAIASLKLDPERAEKLRALLVERAQVAYEANQVLVEHGSREPRDFPRLIAVAQAGVEVEMREYFGEALFRRIESMLQLAPYLRRISQIYDPRMAAAGAPLMNEQVLPLAAILAQAYGAPDDTRARPRASDLHPATGLTVSEEAALQAAAGLLTPPQLTVLRGALVEHNAGLIRGS